MFFAKIEIGSVVMEKMIFKFVNVFLQFLNYLPLEKGGTLHPRMFCAKFGWNWPSGSGEEDEKCEKKVKNLRPQRQRRRLGEIKKVDRSNKKEGCDKKIKNIKKNYLS